MNTENRPGGINREMIVAEVERTAGTPTLPALHAGNVYKKGPPAWPSPDTPVVKERTALSDERTMKPLTFKDFPEAGHADPARGWQEEKAARNVRNAGFGYDALPNPKTLVGNTKVPMLSVIPAVALVKIARAMQYGAFFAPRKDSEQPGYGAQNWRDQNIEYMTYLDAAVRHLLASADGEDADPDTATLGEIEHLELAAATLVILIDARAQGLCIDNRPIKKSVRGLAATLLRVMRQK